MGGCGALCLSSCGRDPLALGIQTNRVATRTGTRPPPGLPTSPCPYRMPGRKRPFHFPMRSVKFIKTGGGVCGDSAIRLSKIIRSGRYLLLLSYPVVKICHKSGGTPTRVPAQHPHHPRPYDTGARGLRSLIASAPGLDGCPVIAVGWAFL